MIAAYPPGVPMLRCHGGNYVVVRICGPMRRFSPALEKSCAVPSDKRYRSVGPWNGDPYVMILIQGGDAMLERTKSCEGVRTAIPTMRSPDSLEFGETEVTVEDIMTEAIISAAPEEAVLSAAQRMSEHNISCIAVTTGERAVGILTERDVLKGVAAGYEEFVGATVAEKMSSPVISVPPDLRALEASALMESRGIKRLLVVQGERLIGVATQTNITQSLVSMCRFKSVSELMTSDVVMVSPTTSITDGAQLMASRNISCLVILHRREAAGIVTESDILQRVATGGENPATTPIAEIMSFPVVAVPLTYSVGSANQKMQEMHIHRLLVGSAQQVEGIITQTDIMAAVRRNLEEAREARLCRQREMSQLVNLATKKLLLIQDWAGGSRPPADSMCQRPSAPDRDPDRAELQSLISELQDNLEKLTAIIQDPD